jgi:hypothetical protein
VHMEEVGETGLGAIEAERLEAAAIEAARLEKKRRASRLQSLRLRVRKFMRPWKVQRKLDHEAAADGETNLEKVDEGLEVEVAGVEVAAAAAGAETPEDVAKYCGVEKKNGKPCQFDISAKPCPVHKEIAVRKPEELCNRLRANGCYCKWNVSIRACPKHPSAADDAAKEAARLLLPECQEITRSNKICLVRGCCFHAPLDLRCHSMKEANHTLRCYGFKTDGSEFCELHQEFPNLSVNMVEMLQTIPGDKLTEEDFRAKYYPGKDTAFSFNFEAYVRSMRALVH